MVTTTPPLKVGDRVSVHWGLDADKHGVIVDVWGDPPSNIRVEVQVGEGEEPELLLLSPSAVTRDQDA